ncbi:MAG: hypothetical protein K6G40_01040 [Eubacterium sp.]|nr:hypothetical protein [Eubacterium sp.]
MENDDSSEKFKKPLQFVLALIPIAIVGRYFTGVYGWTELTDDVKNHIPQVAETYRGKPSFSYWMASVFNGGVIEEVMLRLFMMPLIAFIMEDFLPKRSKSPQGRHNCSKYHISTSICGRSSAVYNADVWRNNTDDFGAKQIDSVRTSDAQEKMERLSKAQ